MLFIYLFSQKISKLVEPRVHHVGKGTTEVSVCEIQRCFSSILLFVRVCLCFCRTILGNVVLRRRRLNAEGASHVIHPIITSIPFFFQFNFIIPNSNPIFLSQKPRFHSDLITLCSNCVASSSNLGFLGWKTEVEQRKTEPSDHWVFPISGCGGGGGIGLIQIIGD